MINIQALPHAFRFAIQGVGHALQSDQNLRIHFVVAILVVCLALFFHVSYIEFAILAVMITFVIVTEMINTAIENVVDLVTKENHLEAKIAKDVAAGMVLITATGSVIVGVFIFLPYIFGLFS